jgi:hypothetical protein
MRDNGRGDQLVVHPLTVSTDGSAVPYLQRPKPHQTAAKAAAVAAAAVTDMLRPISHSRPQLAIWASPTPASTVNGTIAG